jgi:hypothetical protein
LGRWIKKGQHNRKKRKIGKRGKEVKDGRFTSKCYETNEGGLLKERKYPVLGGGGALPSV